MIFATQDGSRIFIIKGPKESNFEGVITKYVGMEFEFTILSLDHSGVSLIMNTDQGLYVCGNNEDGQLGSEDPDLYETTLTKIPFAHQVFLVACGDYHTVIYSSDGLYTTGLNERGQLGLGCDTDVHAFTRVNFEYEVISIVCGLHYTLILSANGLYVSGFSVFIPPCLLTKTFKRMPIDEPITSIAAGDDHMMVQVQDGIYIAGNNLYHQLMFTDTKPDCEITKIDYIADIIRCSLNYTIVTTGNIIYVCGSISVIDSTVISPHPIIDIMCKYSTILVYTTGGIYRLYYNKNYDLELTYIESEIPRLNSINRRYNHTKSARN